MENSLQQQTIFFCSIAHTDQSGM